MPTRPTVFGQLLQLLPFSHFEHLVHKHQSNWYAKDFTAWAHLVCLLYAHLSRRDGLRDLVACLNAQQPLLYHLGVRARVARSTLADANESRNCRLFEDLSQRLVSIAQELYQVPHLTLEALSAGPLQESESWDCTAPLYAMDSSTIELCMSLFPWAKYRRSSAAVKLHAVIDLRGCIPVMLRITEGRVADVFLLEELRLPAGSFVIFDRGYLDFEGFHKLVQRGCHFVTRARSDLAFETVRSLQPTNVSNDANTAGSSLGVQSDLIIHLKTVKSKRAYPKPLRRVRFVDADTAQELVFLSDRLDLQALQIAQLYKQRWQVELFFKWLKQHLCIKHFYGTSDNAVKSQIWCAICAYLLLLIAHKPHAKSLPMHTFIHLVETNLFSCISLSDLVKTTISQPLEGLSGSQIKLL